MDQVKCDWCCWVRDLAFTVNHSDPACPVKHFCSAYCKSTWRHLAVRKYKDYSMTKRNIRTRVEVVEFAIDVDEWLNS